jgi:hypothetical protein
MYKKYSQINELRDQTSWCRSSLISQKFLPLCYIAGHFLAKCSVQVLKTRNNAFAVIFKHFSTHIELASETSDVDLNANDVLL